VHRWRAELLAFIEASADIVLANEGELHALFETENFDHAAAHLGRIVEVAAVTRGGQVRSSSAATSGSRSPPSPSTRWSTPRARATSTPPACCWVWRAACRLAEAGALGSLAASEVIAHWGPRPMVKLEALAAEHGLKL
jgi:sugar/nucleoside kinase (ribokinase family)